MSTYSFLNVQAAIVGPGGAFSLGNGAGVAEEGISIDFIEEADHMTTGADGTPMHSLNASKAARVVVRLLKTSLVNGMLQAMYNFQRVSSSNWGINTMTVTDVARGDLYSMQQVAFVKPSANKYGKDANVMEWEFNVGVCDPLLAIIDN